MAAEPEGLDVRARNWSAVGMAVTIVLLAAGGLASWQSYSTTRALAKRELRMVQLKGVVTHLDEVLTMSARMAAATADLAWETRYIEQVAPLDAAIREMRDTAPTPAVGAFAAQADAANQRLVEMETRAFDLVRAGRAGEASELLDGDGYREQKQRYAAAMTATMAEVESEMKASIDAHGKRVVMIVSLFGVVLLGAIIARRRATAMLRTRSHRLAEALATTERDHAALAEAHRQLGAMHRELVEKEKLSNLGLLAAGVAHEINNPMAFVTMNVHTLVEDLQDIPPEQLPEQLRIYLDELLPSTLDGIQRVNTIVRDLQQFARGDVDAATTFDLNAEISAAVRISNNQLKGRARLELSLGPLPPLYGKPRQMTQIMVNLIVNASHAIGERPDGSIRITSTRDHDRAVVEIRDNGSGMSRDVMARVFEPFFTTKDVGTGTGLGLSVVYGIVHAHGGTITVDSEIGVGTCFRLELPLAAVSEPKPIVAQITASDRPSSGTASRPWP